MLGSLTLPKQKKWYKLRRDLIFLSILVEMVLRIVSYCVIINRTPISIRGG